MRTKKIVEPAPKTLAELRAEKQILNDQIKKEMAEMKAKKKAISHEKKMTKNNLKLLKSTGVSLPVPVEGENTGELTVRQMKALAPAAFTEENDENLSGRYVFIQTSKVIKQLARTEFKFFPVRAEQVTKRKNNDGLQRHVIVFRSNDPRLSITDEFGEKKETVQLYLTNSHDGTTNFTISLGIFKFDSGNDFHIPESILGSIKMKHVGYTLDRLSSQIESLLESIPYIQNRIDTMKRRILTDEEMMKFAVNACKARWDDEVQIKEDELIQAMGDKVNLWNAFSTMQLALTKGSEIKANDRKIRPLHHIIDRESVNKKLFQIADNFFFSTVNQ